MIETLRHALHHRNPFVRKGAVLALQLPKRFARLSASSNHFAETPPILANSVPKSGTHLLDQIVEGFPDRRNYGAFLSSMTSSFQMRERSTSGTLAFLEQSVPGEIVRGHLFYAPEYAGALQQKNFVHFFIYRDPRDVVVSEAHYLWKMNRWHRLHKHFQSCQTAEDAILLSIRGLKHVD